MREREISPEQARSLIVSLKRENPNLERNIAEHKWFMSERTGYDVGKQVAETDYLMKKLSPKEEGYAVCFLEMVPRGMHFLPKNKKAHCDKCERVNEILRAQGKELIEEFRLNSWYYGEKKKRAVSPAESERDFLQNCSGWFIGYRECYEERVCEHRGNKCKCYQEKFVRELPERIKKLFEQEKTTVAEDMPKA